MPIYNFVFGFLLDLCFGDPSWLPHPVKIIGFFIRKSETVLLKTRFKKLSGIMLLLLIAGGTYFFTAYFLIFARSISPLIGRISEIFLIYTTIAIHDLYIKSMKIFSALSKNNLPQARKSLAHIVGRDTENLTEEEIIRATIECIAESTTDGIISPLFFSFIGGAPLALTYKAVNTLDSMVGYKNEKYRDFGWASARFDDFLNYIPARISGLLIPLSAFFCRKKIGRSFQTIFDDAKKHPSPNSGIPEAAMAGALEIQLGGANYYQGIKEERALMGKSIKPLSKQDIVNANRIMLVTSFLMVFICVSLFFLGLWNHENFLIFNI